MLLFLKLYLSHLIADFLLQPNRIAKKKRSFVALLAHSGIHVAVAIAIVNVDLSVRITAAIAILSVAHAGCDYVKARFTKDEWWAFAIDQFVHFLLIAIAAVWLTGDGLPQILTILRSSRRLYLLLCVYIAVVLGGGYFVQKVTSYFMNKIDESVARSKPGLPAAGKYIGWLERTLVLTFLITGYPEGIGLLLAAKALVRYPEIKEDQKGHFAEYFLIGTLTSVSIALVAGLIAMKFLSRF
jgi:uncharacterized protein DUF3307